MATPDRAEALRRLAELGASGATSVAADTPTVERTGNEDVYAGGDNRRLLVRRAHLSYMDKGVRHYPEAGPGDVVLLDDRQAKRLDALGVTVDPDASDEEVEDAAAGEVTDEQLRAMSAAELVAHVGQHPDHRERVRALEEERDEDKRRKTVLEATDPEAGNGE